MINKELYLKKYRSQKISLEESNELWRLCEDSEEIFISKLNEIYDRYEKEHFLNEFQRASSTKKAIDILLQKKMSKEERILQTKRMNEATKESFIKATPKIKAYASKMRTPLTISDLSHIYRWISRDQITLNDLQNEVEAEFKKSKQYESLIERGILNISYSKHHR